MSIKNLHFLSKHNNVTNRLFYSIISSDETIHFSKGNDMPTIRDVAKLTGLSLGTVSNVINGVPSVSEENRKRVNEAIAVLGYRRNQAASQLRSNKSNSIGLVIPNITNPFYPEIARGVDDTARKAGFDVFLCNKDRSAEKEEAAIEALLGKNVDGILLFKPRISDEYIAKISSQCALVLMDVDPDMVTCDTVNVDDEEGMRCAVTEVIRMGHKRIAFISGLPDSISSARRLHTYQSIMKNNQLPQPEEYVQYGDFTFEYGVSCVRRLMALPQPPTAIMTANDMMALGVISGALDMGLSVPEDLSVVGYDDVQNVQWSRPCLTTTWHPKYEMGEAAANLLIEQIRARRESVPYIRRNLLMMTRFRMRDTLCPPKNNR